MISFNVNSTDHFDTRGWMNMERTRVWLTIDISDYRRSISNTINYTNNISLGKRGNASITGSSSINWENCLEILLL